VDLRQGKFSPGILQKADKGNAVGGLSRFRCVINAVDVPAGNLGPVYLNPVSQA
jgi:hypothetical protein